MVSVAGEWLIKKTKQKTKQNQNKHGNSSIQSHFGKIRSVDGSLDWRKEGISSAAQPRNCRGGPEDALKGDRANFIVITANGHSSSEEWYFILVFFIDAEFSEI